MAETAAKLFAKHLGSKEAARAEAKTSVLLFFSPAELDTLANGFWDKIRSLEKIDVQFSELEKLLKKMPPFEEAKIMFSLHAQG